VIIGHTLLNAERGWRKLSVERAALRAEKHRKRYDQPGKYSSRITSGARQISKAADPSITGKSGITLENFFSPRHQQSFDAKITDVRCRRSSKLFSWLLLRCGNHQIPNCDTLDLRAFLGISPDSSRRNATLIILN
jgi:hypothetical protein